MKNKPTTEFEQFDKTMDALLSVSKGELQRKLDAEKRAKERKKRSVKTASSRVSASGKKRER